MTLEGQTITRECADCGGTIMRGEGGIRAFGLLFCCEDCADAYEEERER